MTSIIYIVITTLLLATVQSNQEAEYCDIEGETCNTSKSAEKFMFYDVNPPEGFNLRRDVYMRFAIMLAEAQKIGKSINWRLVLPPWYRLYHWRSQVSKDEPQPWSTFFNVKSLQSYSPVVELHDVFSMLPKTKKFEIDLHVILQNFDDAFEGGTFKEKWEINNDGCKYDGEFWGYRNITAIETICVKFQGKISKLWELTNLHYSAKTVMFSHGEIPLHDNYGTKSYWDCRKSMKFNEKLIEIAKNFIRNNLKCEEEKCDTYLSVHWRRQDFAHSRKKDVPSVPGTISQIDEFIRNKCPDLLKIFIATDATYREISQLEKGLMRLGFEVYFYIPYKRVVGEFKDGGVAIIEQIICSRGAYFIGTHESTYTFRIQEEREILGFNSNTTFNRLCPDDGKCEKMSQWTLVN